MSTCAFCDTTFLRASSAGPAEDCDCGQNAPASHVRTLSAEDYWRAKWAADATLANLRDEDKPLPTGGTRD